MWTPRDNSVLELEWGRGGRTTFSKSYSHCFVDVHTKFPFGEVSV
jgi:hypothetical protein